MGAYLLRETERALREKAGEKLSYAVLRQGAYVDEWLGDRLRELGRWSASFVLFEGVPGLRASPSSGGLVRRDLKAFLDSLLEHNPVYESLFVADPDGRILASTRPEALEPQALRAIREMPAGTGRLGPVFRSDLLGRPTLLAAHSIQDRNARSVGILVGRIDLAQLEARLRSPRDEPTLTFGLFDAGGRAVVLAGRTVAAPGSDRMPASLGTDRLRGGVSSVPLALPGPDGEPLLHAARSLDGPLPGYVLATLPEAVAYKALAESRRNLLAAGVPLLLLAVAVTGLLARQLLLPIRRLAAGARRMSDGELDVRLPEGGRDEIGDLTRAFNEMALRVREGRASLEQARDELARSNAELKDANVALEELAITDGLTGLYNHRHFQETWARELARAQRLGQPASLLMVDLDHFKDYNDRYGHTAGDEALRSVAGCLRAGLRASDLAFRYGGEELVAVLPGCGKEASHRVADAVRTAVKRIPTSVERPRPLTVSIGVASYPEDGTTVREVLDRADAALYRAKADGRDRVVAFRLEGPSPVAG
jgi:diguanylate cyclase (GGDEF)-like protein